MLKRPGVSSRCLGILGWRDQRSIDGVALTRNAESLFEYSATHPCHPTLPEIKDFSAFGDAHCLKCFALCSDAPPIPKWQANTTSLACEANVLDLRRKSHLGPIRIVWDPERDNAIKNRPQARFPGLSGAWACATLISAGRCLRCTEESNDHTVPTNTNSLNVSATKATWI